MATNEEYYLLGRREAETAELEAWKQSIVGPPDISLTKTPTGTTQPKTNPYGTEFPNIMADELLAVGKEAVGAVKKQLTTEPSEPGQPTIPAPTTQTYEPGKTMAAIPEEERAGLLGQLGAVFNPTLAERAMRAIGATPTTDEDMLQAMTQSGIPPAVAQIILPYMSAVHGAAPTGRKPPEAKAAGELLQGKGAQEGAPTRLNMSRFSPEERQSKILETLNQLNVESGAVEAQATRVGHAETTARSQGKVTAQMLIDKPPGVLLPDIPPNEQVAAADRLLLHSRRTIVDLAKRTAAGDTEAADLLYDALAIHSKIDQQGIDIGEAMGRGLEARKIAAEARPATAAEAQVSRESLREIADRLRMGGAAPGEPPSIDPTSLATMILQNQTLAGGRGVSTFTRGLAQAKGPGFMDMLFEWWINGLLSNPETHLRNMANNLQMAITGVPLRALASTMGSPGGVASGEATAMLHGLIAGWDDAMKAGWQALRTGKSAFQEAGKFGAIQPSITGEAVQGLSRGAITAAGPLGRAVDFIGQVTRLPGRFLMSADDFGKTINYRMELQALAVRDGMQQGLSGSKLSDHIAETVANPPATIHDMATNYAFYNTLNSEITGKFGRWMEAGRQNVPGFRWVEPFLRIQSNIMKMSFENLPGLNLALDTVQAHLATGGARADLAMAKMVAGSLTLASAASLAASGQLTGGGPVNPELNRIWRQTHQPYSFKFPGTDTWFSYAWTGPLAMVLAIPATMVEMGDSLPEAGWDQLAMATAMATGEIFLDQTWSKGLFEVMQALREPQNKGLDYLRNFARSALPGAVGEVEKLLDPVARSSKPPQTYIGSYDVRGKHHWKEIDSLLTQWAARTPGFSTQLPPTRDRWGKPQLQSFGVKPAEEDPVDHELIRLRIGLPAAMPIIYGHAGSDSPYADQDRPSEGVPLTAQEYDLYRRLDGNELKLDTDLGKLGLHDALAKLITTPAYQQLTDGPDGTKAWAIQRYAHNYREGAKAWMLEKNPQLRELVKQRIEERIGAKVAEPSGSLRSFRNQALGIQK